MWGVAQGAPVLHQCICLGAAYFHRAGKVTLTKRDFATPGSTVPTMFFATFYARYDGLYKQLSVQ